MGCIVLVILLRLVLRGGDNISNKSKNQIEAFILGKCKDLIIKDFQENANITSLILGYGATAIDLKDNNVFDTLVIDLSQNEAKTYVTMDAIILNSGATIKCVEITLNVFTHLSKLSLSTTEKAFYYKQGFYGNRIDVLSDAVIRCLRGSNEYGIGELQLRERNTMRIFQPNENYYGKQIVFQVYDF